MVYLILPLNKEADIEGKPGDKVEVAAKAAAEAENAVANAAEVDATRDITKK
jgi:hypothetical protein